MILFLRLIKNLKELLMKKLKQRNLFVNFAAKNLQKNSRLEVISQKLIQVKVINTEKKY
jgi:hypothetical protein